MTTHTDPGDRAAVFPVSVHPKRYVWRCACGSGTEPLTSYRFKSSARAGLRSHLWVVGAVRPVRTVRP